MTAPFMDAREPEVCARVAIQLLKHVRRKRQLAYSTPSLFIGDVVRELDGLAFKSVRSCFFSLNAWLLDGRTSKSWLSAVVYRSRMGYTLRRCMHNEYKGTRTYPRVTNRGVGSRSLSTSDSDNGLQRGADSAALADD
jgi:hypothetical protein